MSADAPLRFLTAQWRDLLMLNYAAPARLLAPLVPAGTTLDLWRGEALVSLVGFRFLETRLLGLPIPGHQNFDEVNLRFYVRRESDGGPRRGVVFIREFVPRRAIAWLARAIYNEPYRAVPMRHSFERDGTALRYEWRAGAAWSGLSAEIAGPPSAFDPGSEAEFITEHYWGYTRQRDGGTVEYQVAHPSWKVWEAQDAQVLGDLAASYGAEWASLLSQRPQSTFVAEGSAVTVFRGRRLDGGQQARDS